MNLFTIFGNSELGILEKQKESGFSNTLRSRRHSIFLASCINSYLFRCTCYLLLASPQPLNVHIVSLILDWRPLISSSRSGARPLPEANISDGLSGNCFFHCIITLVSTPILYNRSFVVSPALITVRETLA